MCKVKEPLYSVLENNQTGSEAFKYNLTGVCRIKDKQFMNLFLMFPVRFEHAGRHVAKHRCLRAA